MAAPKKTEVAKTDDVTDIINAPLAGAFDIPMTPGMSSMTMSEPSKAKSSTFEGSPYTVVDKETLIGKEFLITDLRTFVGDYGPAVSVMAITKDDERIVFVDGSTGIYEQVKFMSDRPDARPDSAAPMGSASPNTRTKLRTGPPLPLRPITWPSRPINPYP